MKNTIMKYPMILTAFICSQVSLFSQTVEIENPKYTLLSEVVATHYDFLNQVNGSQSEILHNNYVFQEIATTIIDGTEFTILKPIEFLELDKDYQQKSNIILHTYYTTNSLNLENNRNVYTARGWELRLGYHIIPVKIYAFQEGPLDFTASSISQGPAIGISHQLSKRKSNLWLTYNFSMNFTKVTPRIDDFTETYNGNDLAALSPALGLNLNYNNVEFGIYLGRDYLPGLAADTWKYNGVTWYSIAIGTSFGSAQ